MITELYTELLFIIYYFTVAEKNVLLVHAGMLQISLSLFGAKTYIIKQHSDAVYFKNARLFLFSTVPHGFQNEMFLKMHNLRYSPRY